MRERERAWVPGVIMSKEAYKTKTARSRSTRKSPKTPEFRSRSPQESRSLSRKRRSLASPLVSEARQLHKRKSPALKTTSQPSAGQPSRVSTSQPVYLLNEEARGRAAAGLRHNQYSCMHLMGLVDRHDHGRSEFSEGVPHIR